MEKPRRNSFPLAIVGTLLLVMASGTQAGIVEEEFALPLADEEIRQQRVLAWKPTGQTDSVLICLHGIQTHAEWFRPLGRELAPRGTAVYALDRRGSGKGHDSSPSDCTDWNLWIDDIQIAAEAIRKRYPNPKTPIYLTGISWGGKTTLGALLDESFDIFDGGILIAPAFATTIDPPLPGKLGFALAAALSPSAPVDLEEQLGLMRHHYSTRNNEDTEALLNDHRLLKSVTRRFLIQSNKQFNDAKRRIGNLDLPILALYGSEDALVKTFKTDQILVPLRANSSPPPAAIGQTRFSSLILEGLNHASIIEDADRLASIIRRWIEGRAGQPSPEGELWMPAHATGFGEDDKGRSKARGRRLRESPRGFPANIEVTRGKAITIRRDPEILWQDRDMEPASMKGNRKTLPIQKLVQHTLVLRRDKKGAPVPYFALLALVEQTNGKVSKSVVEFDDMGVARWTPPVSGKLSFLANDATVPSPRMVYTNNTGTLRLTIEE